MNEPWHDIRADESIAKAMERQLHSELPAGHVLAGMMPTAIARREDRDDVLFDLGDGRFAVVHLTWKRTNETDARWPTTVMYSSWAAVNARLDQDAAEFQS